MKCFLVREPNLNGGGNSLSHLLNNIVVRRTAAIGDALAATCVADRLSEMGFGVNFQTHVNIHCLLRRQKSIWALAQPGGHADIDLDQSYERDKQRRQKHFSQMFFEAANNQLRSRGLDLGPPINCRPRIKVADSEKAAAIARFTPYPKPWIFICPRSNSYNVRQVPDGIWKEAAARFNGTAFWLGTHPAPDGIIDLQCRHLDNVILWLAAADLLVTVDTGPLHIAAALGTPIVAILQSSSPEQHLSNQVDFISISPPLDCLNCQKNLCPFSAHIPPCQNIDPNLVADTVNARLRSLTSDDISASIAIYRPPAERLNRCIEAVLPQVSEVVVANDTAGRVPEGAIRHPKVRYVTMPLHDTGYGKKQTFANRQCHGKFLLQLNDDCYVQPTTVATMRAEMRRDVGMVACLLKYPDGRIQHAGTVRSPGQRGWHHLDQHKHDHTLKEPCEMENVTGACVLVQRRAFFDVNGFDERFYLCCEDNDLCLKMRRAGWKIRYTPLTWAIHEESVTSRHTPNFIQIVKHSSALLGQKWERYFEWNKNRIPLGNFDYERV